MPTELVCPFKNEIIYYNTLSTEQELWFNQNVYGVIYRITNMLNNKSYIGRRKCIKNKLSALHKYWGSGSHIKNAIKKYGLENFTKEYLDFAMSDEELDKLEIFYIEKFGTFKNGYNQTIGGEHFRGEIHNVQSLKQKRSEWSKQFWSNKENYKRLVGKRTGRKNSDATKKLMSESAKKSWTDERKRRASESGNYKREISQEQIEIHRQKIIGSKWVTDGKQQFLVKPNEVNLYLSKGFHLGKLPVDESTRNRMSVAAKNRKPTTLGRIAIHKGSIKKYIYKENLKDFLKDGWEQGLPKVDIEKSKNHKTTKGRKSIIKDGIIKLVQVEELENYLNDGWSLNVKEKPEVHIKNIEQLPTLLDSQPFYFNCCNCGKGVHIKVFVRSRIPTYQKMLCRSCNQKIK